MTIIFSIMLKKVEETRDFILGKIDYQPEFGIILGTGLGGLVDEIEIDTILAYKDIPNFPLSTVFGHEGRLIFGRLSGKTIVAMQGRFHFYEGYSMEEVTFPVRVMKLLGIKLLIVSNASGGMNPEFGIGDLMFISDHINLMPNPLIGKNEERLGVRFPDMSEPYDLRILHAAQRIARKAGINVHEGVYVGVTGPTFETPAEYQYLRIIGGDAVGMSTVPEVIVARHMELAVFAVSIISDLGIKGKIVEISHEDVIEAANAAQPKMSLIIKELLKENIV